MKVRSLSTLFALFAVFALVASPALAFPCYCNGEYLGEYTDVMACYNDCMKKDDQIEPANAEQALPTIEFLTPEAPQASIQCAPSVQ